MYRKPKRIKKKKSLFKNKFLWIFFALCVFAGFLFYGIAFSQIFQVKNIQVKGNGASLETEVRAFVDQSIQHKIVLFTSKSIVFSSLKKIEQAGLKQFPEIESLSIRRKFPNSLVVSFVNKKESAVWCKQKDQCVAIDSKGAEFKEQKAQGEFTIFATDNTLFPALLNFKNRVEALSAFSVHTQLVFVSGTVVSEYQIRLQTSEKWEIYFDPSEDMAWQIAKLQAVLDRKFSPDQRKKLQYIDVRFGDQAYIK